MDEQRLFMLLRNKEERERGTLSAYRNSFRRFRNKNKKYINTRAVIIIIRTAKSKEKL